jgi:tripartite ATP-independent transporter DctP family solute receptor
VAGLSRSQPRFRAHPALLLGAVTSLACAPEAGVSRIALAHGLDPSHPVHRAMEGMAADVAERSGGSLVVDLYPSEQLGSERECLELLQIGSLGMTKVSAAVLENFAPGYRVLSMPYVFRDAAHRFAVLDGEIGRELLRSSHPFRLRGLAFYDAGSRSFYTRERPVYAPADLGGLKIRVQESPTAVALVTALGAFFNDTATTEIYTALQHGVVDGAENNPPSFRLSGHYEIARYYTLDEPSAVPDVLLISALLWERLEERQRGWLEAAAAESVAVQRELWREATEQALAAVAADGVEIIQPDKAPFAERTAAVRAALADDPAASSLLRRIEAQGS